MRRRATPPPALGRELRRAGLVPRALAAWAGTDRASALVPLLPRLATRDVTPASAVLALFVAGAEVELDKLRGIETVLELLIAHGLLHLGYDRARAPLAVVPVGPSLLVCDRAAAPEQPDLVCWPDDSSYHLARALPPGRRARWLDLACGSAFAPLHRPELGAQIAATDVNSRAVLLADLGAALSGVDHLSARIADIGAAPRDEDLGAYDLVSCNAPIPEPSADPYRPRWKVASAAFVPSLVETAARCVAPGGMVVIHAALDALDPVLAAAPGERVVVSYTPPGVRAFGVAWWRPDGEDRLVAAHRPLVPDRPHLTHEDRDAALAGTLAPR